jgi:hypothetical protein
LTEFDESQPASDAMMMVNPRPSVIKDFAVAGFFRHMVCFSGSSGPGSLQASDDDLRFEHAGAPRPSGKGRAEQTPVRSAIAIY